GCSRWPSFLTESQTWLQHNPSCFHTVNPTCSNMPVPPAGLSTGLAIRFAAGGCLIRLKKITDSTTIMLLFFGPAAQHWLCEKTFFGIWVDLMKTLSFTWKKSISAGVCGIRAAKWLFAIRASFIIWAADRC